MRLRHLWLTDFRSYPSVELEGPPGLCVLHGPNGVGKSNLLEAIGWLSTLSSFRGAPTDALVRAGCEQAVVRGEVDHDGRTALVESSISPNGRNRVQVNRQRVARGRDLLDTLRVSVFSPDDLALLKGGPALRRDYLDDLAVGLHPRNDAVRSDWERALRQRNALLKQVGGRLDASAELTLEVWDTKATESGSELGRIRAELVADLTPAVQEAYVELADRPEEVGLRLVPGWDGELGAALVASRRDELRRGVTLVGPHRAELVVTLNGMPARTHASQGEQRGLALALRLAAHRLVRVAVGAPPVLLLDDVFSELDPARSTALLSALPQGQAFLTTAGALPAGVEPDIVIEVTPGALAPRAAR